MKMQMHCGCLLLTVAAFVSFLLGLKQRLCRADGAPLSKWLQETFFFFFLRLFSWLGRVKL